MKTKLRLLAIALTIAGAFFALGFSSAELTALSARQSWNSYQAFLWTQWGYPNVAARYQGAADEDTYLMNQGTTRTAEQPAYRDELER